MREYVDSGEYVSVNTVRGLRNWRGNMGRRPEARIAPPISKTEDCIYDTSEPEPTYSHCVGENLWICMIFHFSNLDVLLNTSRFLDNLDVLTNTSRLWMNYSLFTNISTSVSVNTKLSGQGKPKVLTYTMAIVTDNPNILSYNVLTAAFSPEK